jgi:hypothetical protein
LAERTGLEPATPGVTGPVLISSSMSECKRATVKTAIYLNLAGVRSYSLLAAW